MSDKLNLLDQFIIEISYYSIYHITDVEYNRNLHFV